MCPLHRVRLLIQTIAELPVLLLELFDGGQSRHVLPTDRAICAPFRRREATFALLGFRVCLCPCACSCAQASAFTAAIAALLVLLLLAIDRVAPQIAWTSQQENV